MATFWQTPYFFVRLTLLSPATDFAPPSESLFLLLPVDRWDDLRVSFGVDARRSLRLNRCLSPSLECTDDARPVFDGVRFGSGVVGGAELLPAEELRAGAVGGGASLPPETPADMLGALLGAWLGGLVEGRLQLSRSESVGEEADDAGWELSLGRMAPWCCFSESFSSAGRVYPGCFSSEPLSGGGSGTWWTWCMVCGAKWVWLLLCFEEGAGGDNVTVALLLACGGGCVAGGG